MSELPPPTTYEDSYVALVLPGAWQRQPNSRQDFLVFRDGSKHQLSVSLLYFDRSGAYVLGDVQRYFEYRLMQERHHLAPDDPITIQAVEMSDGAPLGSYFGVQRAASRLFSGFVTARHRQLVTVYLESLGQEVRAHAVLAAQIFRGLTIKEPAENALSFDALAALQAAAHRPREPELDPWMDVDPSAPLQVPPQWSRDFANAQAQVDAAQAARLSAFARVCAAARRLWARFTGRNP